MQKLPTLPEESYFKNKKTTIDLYDEIIDSVIDKDTVLLDAGCGKKSLVAGHTSRVAFSVGMDVSLDAIKLNNAFRARVGGNSYSLPFKDNTFDVVVSQWMMEHIKDAEKVIREFKRVLRKDGVLIMVTNSIFHPMMFISAILPAGLRDRLKDRIFPSYIEEDTFPTYYNFNSLRGIHSILSRMGFEKRFASYSGAPFFLFNKTLFKLSELYERLTDIKFLRCMKMHVLICYKKTT